MSVRARAWVVAVCNSEAPQDSDDGGSRGGGLGGWAVVIEATIQQERPIVVEKTKECNVAKAAVKHAPPTDRQTDRQMDRQTDRQADG